MLGISGIAWINLIKFITQSNVSLDSRRSKNVFNIDGRRNRATSVMNYVGDDERLHPFEIWTKAIEL